MSKLSSVFAVTGIFELTRVFEMTVAVSLLLSPVVVPAADDVVEPGEAASLQQADAASSVSSPWPMRVTGNGRTFLIYQPQVDKWENNRLEGRCAVAIRNDASGQQNFGVIHFSARSELDQGSRTVTVRDAVIGNADFPAVTSGVDDYLSVLRPQFAAQSWRVAQDRLQSDMEIDRLARQSAKQPLRNDPPRILYSERPAVLVPIDGNPALRPVADTGLMRVTNTRALILQDKATSGYFLFVSDHWVQAPSLQGPWLVTANASAQLQRAKQIAVEQDQVDLLESDSEDGAAAAASAAIFVATTPTELLQTDGAAQYAPIERTQLLYVTNSPNKLFLDLRTQYYYALISGRWYRATTLAQGPWSYVPGASLPTDFAMIPAEHPTEAVRAAVPGTPQAREAAIANTVPQVATVTRSAAHLELTYDGDPVFQPIEGTVLQNALNSLVPVIRISEQSFYALDNGVWFVASSPFGPWTLAGYVPSVIYSIPRSSPLYYVTYVRVYDATPEVVYVGYTPGYVGSYVSSDNVVVYGTGWPYRPWIGSVWYGAPVTWGFGFSFFYSWWYPYPSNTWHQVAWAPLAPCMRPSWGPWHAPVPSYWHRRPAIVAGRANSGRASGPGSHDVGRIYERWDRKSVVWNGPRAIARQQRPVAPTLSRPVPGTGFVAGPDGRWRRLGDDGNRDRGARDAHVRGDVASSPAVQAPAGGQRPSAVGKLPAVQTPPAVQTTWRRPPDANQEHRDRVQPAQPLRVQPPSFGEDASRRADNRQMPPRERVWDQRQASEARADGRPVIDGSHANAQQDRPAPQVQSRQRIPAVAGVAIDRGPSQPQRAVSEVRSFSPPQGRIERPAISTGRIERPAIANPERIERSVAASPGRGTERPAANAGRGVEWAGNRPSVRVNEGQRQSNSGGARGGFRIGQR